ncbi:MAG TPA: serine hydrolase [Prolixibacteraceae bacterium]|jgi:CubicO group peptidase (beta-lactamase class C family)
MYSRVKKLAFTILVFAFIQIGSVQAGNNFPEGGSPNAGLSDTENDTIGLKNLTMCSPKDLGMNPDKLSQIDAIVNAGIKARVFPGCQVLVLKEGKPVYNKCFGNYTYDVSQKVQPTTMYDLASLSKTTGTLLAIMKLYDNGQLRLTDKASKYLPFLQGTDKVNITIKELLFHESGLPAYLDFYRLLVEKNIKTTMIAGAKTTGQTLITDKNRIMGTDLRYKEGWVSGILSAEYPTQVSDSIFVSHRFHDAAMQSIANTKLLSKTYCYSCLNFILLKEIVETISGTSMDVFLDREFYLPMKLNNMAYLPLRTHKREEMAPTLKNDVIRKEEIQGYVHDMDAALLGGVSGNAGLFASAGDVAAIYQMLLNKGEKDGKRYLSAETCNLFTTTTSPSGRRGLGFDKPAPPNSKHSPCCISAPPVVYGHTGYTGTCCWVDPLNSLVYVFLSNRTFPFDGVNKLAKTGIRTRIQDVIYQSIKK